MKYILTEYKVSEQKCFVCNQINKINDSELEKCEFCGELICEIHKYECDNIKCSKVVCINCQKKKYPSSVSYDNIINFLTCNLCTGIYCKDHIYRCEQCGKSVCENCFEYVQSVDDDGNEFNMVVCNNCL